MKGPEAFLLQLELSLPSAVDSQVQALLTPEFRTTVNGHFFWVANAEELATLRAEPYAYTGRLIDPVEHVWFDPSAASPRLQQGEEILLFASGATAEQFRERGREASGHAH